MSNNIRFDYTKAEKFLSQREMESMKFAVMNAKDRLLSGQGEGSDFQGWVDLPVNYDKDEFERIKAAAKKIQSDPTSEQEQPLSIFAMDFTMRWRRKTERHHRFTMWAIA